MKVDVRPGFPDFNFNIIVEVNSIFIIVCNVLWGNITIPNSMVIQWKVMIKPTQMGLVKLACNSPMVE